MKLLRTPLDALHRESGARMVPFAGYELPVQYSAGIIAEHLHTRTAAGLFDVSHMGQVIIEGGGSAALLESLVPADIEGLAENRSTYALFTSDSGGVLDDFIVTRRGADRFFLVVNAACKEQDFARLRSRQSTQSVTMLEQQALLALQGPAARDVMSELCPAAAGLVFMQGCEASIEGVDVYITCSGYTGEDGFEMSVPAAAAAGLARRILAFEQVESIGLGARDSLRLEAGLCLYGHELTPDIDPAQAGVAWAVSKARRAEGERPGGFPGAEVILSRLPDRTPLCRVGLRGEGRRPMREGQSVLDAQGRRVGEVCSAAWGASVGGPIAMAYVEREYGAPGTALSVDARGKSSPATVAALPFVPRRYHRG